MSFTLQQSGEELELNLNGRMGVQNAGPLWEALQELLEDDTTICLNAADLEEMDTSIVQILCRLSAIPGKLRLAGLSEGFVLSLQKRGLANLFIDPPQKDAPAHSAEALEASPGLRTLATIEEGIPA